MNEFVPIETASSLPVADATLSTNSKIVTTNYEYPVKQAEEDKNDFIVEVKASKLRKVRSKLELLANERFPLYECLLGIASAFLGAFLSGLASDMVLNSSKGIIIFIVCPIVATGTGVAYFYQRRISVNPPKVLINDIMDDLADPDKAIGKEDML